MSRVTLMSIILVVCAIFGLTQVSMAQEVFPITRGPALVGAAPVLSSGTVAPATGNTLTVFVFQVSYSDSDGDSPIVQNVYIDGTPYSMTLASGTASNGVYQYSTTLAAGSHTYIFGFTDTNINSARLPDTGEYAGPDVDAFGGSVIYVSETTGSDSNPGTILEPLASITQAVNSAPGSASQMVLIFVAAGTYNENLVLSGYQSLLGGYSVDFQTRNVYARNDSRYATIIDGGAAGTVITCAGLETGSINISGFTIQNGNETNGGGIDGGGAEATIENNTIKNNAALNGAGLYMCNGQIRNNIINNNVASGVLPKGGGLYLCDGLINANVISGNRAIGDNGGEGGGLAYCNAIITNNFITRNSATSPSTTVLRGYGGGMAYCSGNITNNTIYFNNSQNTGGGLFSCTDVTNCIVWNNSANSGAQIYPASSISASFSCIQDWSAGGAGNITSNPLLVDPDYGDFHLQWNSPCIDAGGATGAAADYDGYARPYGSAYDIGADEYTWSGPYRYVPRDSEVYLEWAEATVASPPVTYNVYSASTSGGQVFSAPAPTKDLVFDMAYDADSEVRDVQVIRSTTATLTDPASIVLSGLVNATPYYVVVRAEDNLGVESENTNEIIVLPGVNMMGDIVYNNGFENGMDGLTPTGWTDSAQEGGKTTVYSVDGTDPFEGSFNALVETTGTPVDPNDISIASLTCDGAISMQKDHTYAVSAYVKRSHSQWTRFLIYSTGFSVIHTESFDALDDKNFDSGWQMLYFYFTAPTDMETYVRIDSIVTNARTNGGQTCSMMVDDIQIIDMGIESIVDIYNIAPPPPQYGVRNESFDQGTEADSRLLGGITYTAAAMPLRWNIAMAVDDTVNHDTGYPIWGQEVPAGLANTTGNAGYVKAKAADTSLPSWPAIDADGVMINKMKNNGERHILSFNYGAAGVTNPLLRVFMINNDFSHYSSLFIDPVVGIPATRMWPLVLNYTPGYGDEYIKVRFDNVTIGASGGGTHTDETTVYIDNVKINVVE